MTDESGNGVLLEIYQVDNAVKVTAVDSVTGVEMSIVGAPDAGEETLKRTAINKLNYVLSKGRAKQG